MRKYCFICRTFRSGNTSVVHYGTGLTDRLGEPPEEEFRAEGLRIDDLLPSLAGRVDFMKVDVEGAEPLAFAGARQTIAANPQIQIVVEWSPGQLQLAGHDLRDFLGSLDAMGLRASTLSRRGPIAISFDDVANLPYQAGLLLRHA